MASQMKSQKEAVFDAIVDVKGTDSFDERVELSGDERTKVSRRLFQEFREGQISYSGDTGDDKKLTTYVSGLISNWLRKDERLNGGVKYHPQNPGSRVGNGDEQLKAMRALLASTSDKKAREDIQREIDRRVEELKPKRAPINIDALPDHLKKYVQQ